MANGNVMGRILVIRIDFLGDMLCTTAFLGALKRHWPGAELHVVANRYNAAVLAGNPDVHAVHTYVYSRQCERNGRPGRVRAFFDRLRLVRELRRLRFDLVIVPNGGLHRSSIRFARQLGARDCRWHDADTEFDDRNPDHVAVRQLNHEALSGFRLVPELGPVHLDDLALSVYPNPVLQHAWEHRFGARVKPRVGLFVSNKAAARRWPKDRWRDLADRLTPFADLIVFRDPALPDALDLSECESAGVREIAPSSVADLIAAASALDVIVSADSAPVHLASALRVPVVALFENRPEKYRRWHPVGVRHVVVRAGVTVDTIGVDAVESAVHDLLSPLAYASATHAGAAASAIDVLAS
ncbi:TPA: glycosyltransferase family 9 protein [Burkholderia multivorans]|uniref:glycosyltransferase family 9 protein n=1 Tax=Burkholderia multivorans TaxID=87883 RepID=UPI000CFFD7E5|nr:glycosyltransferase family 9 protein [Burkholderia multivorans]MBU9299576.1 glycosyltransferase family 9 protein [Burkholderia multivorans]MBU9304999.1 glycosyltransferase family 9 protein [Burkholderia multivorans]MBU9408577.1 glycosyltransferase family 9 protein [Burkholderia multivorans]MBU9438084.1 glycosyltransferase family 9 protein [Burkholderia multivorans]MBU9503856.1 glycosyltransferase family 9 protein [Burkholderia multivorans]